MRWILVLLLATWTTAGEEIELRTRKSTILRKGGVVYFVEGRKKIGHGTEISIQKDVTIVGRGAGAVLEVEGSLKIHGVTGLEVVIKDLVIEPSPRFQEIRLDKVFFRGTGGVRTDPQHPPRGKIVIENTIFEPGPTVNVVCSGGEINFLNSSVHETVHIKGVPPEGKTKTTFKSNILSCFSKMGEQNGSVSGIHMTGLTKVVFRNNRIRLASSFTDCVPLTFDGNKVNSESVTFRHTKPGGFKGFNVQKSDVYSNRLVFEAADGKTREIVTIDKCWFRGLTKKKDIEQKIIAAKNTKIVWKKINKRPLELGGMADR